MPLTDEVLLTRLRGPSGSVARQTREGAADRIEEYCRDAAVAEEAMLRCWCATGKTVDDVKNGDTIDTMAAHVINVLSDAQNRWIPVSERVPAESKNPRKPDYVLAVDAKGNMGVAYCIPHYAMDKGAYWVSAKALGEVTHWMPLPEAPK